MEMMIIALIVFLFFSSPIWGMIVMMVLGLLWFYLIIVYAVTIGTIKGVYNGIKKSYNKKRKTKEEI